MSPTDVMPDTQWPDSCTLTVLTERLPGLLFQLHRSKDGHLHFPYLAGSGTRLLGVPPDHLAQDAAPALQQLDETDYPRMMASIERSVRWQTPITGKFRMTTHDGQSLWIAVRAQPEPVDSGVLWHGMMLDISEQIAEEDRLRQLSDTDSLTGLANRRKLLQRLDEEISISNRHATPLSLLMLDLDHFKHINDTWGHLQGDDVLMSLAEQAQSLLREEDLLARLGGEEFALILPLTSRGNAQRLAERLRHHIATHDFGVGPGNVTASIGLAEHRVGDARDVLLERADQHLYAAKHGGRNRIASDG